MTSQEFDPKNIPLMKFAQLADCHPDTVRATVKEGEITPARDGQGRLQFGRYDLGVMRERVMRKLVR